MGPRPGSAARPLVEFQPSGQPTAVYDAKYKPWGQTPSTGDLYQVVTYAHRLGINRAFLLYPGNGEHSEVSVGRCRVAMLGIHVLNTPLQPDPAPAAPADVAGT